MTGARQPGHTRKPVARAVGALPLVATIAGLTAGVVSAHETYESVQTGQGATAVDAPVQAWMVAHRVAWLDTAATWFTDLGGKVGMPILATVTVLALARWWRTWTPVVVMLWATAGSLALTSVGKVLTDVPRTTWSAGLQLARDPWSGLLVVRHVGAVFGSGDDTNRNVVQGVFGSYDAYTVASAKLGYRFDRRVSASLALDNLTNRRYFVFRYHSAQHWLEVFRTYYGPMLKAFGALDATGQAGLARDLTDLLQRFNQGGPDTLVVPSEYIEVVATRA